MTRPPDLEPNHNGRGEIELACRGNNSLGDDVTAHDSAKDVHKDGVHLKHSQKPYSLAVGAEQRKGIDSPRMFGWIGLGNIIRVPEQSLPSL